MKTQTNFKQTEIGLIPEDWEVKELREEVDVNMGQSPKSEFYNESGEGYLFMQGVRTFGEKYPTFDTYTTQITKEAKAGSVLFSVRAPVGEVNITEKNLCIGRGLSALNMKNGNNEFLYYLLKKFKTQILNFETGSVFGAINGTQIRGLKLPFPEETEQKAIAKILSDLDSKIELLQKQNKTLEAIGQAIFKHWFVDFKFPNEEGKPYKSSGGEMVFNEELGKEIPKGWEVKPLDQIANFLNGLALQKFPPEGDDFLPVIKIKELRQGITEQSDKASPNIDKKYIINDGDVLFSWSGTLMVVIWGEGKGALNQHLFKVTSDNFEKWFYYYWIKNHLRTFIGIAKDKTTTMGHIKRHHLTVSKVLVPNDVILGRMNEIMKSFIRKIIKNKLELRRLISLRDTPLPKLMSGEIRVNNLEAGTE